MLLRTGYLNGPFGDPALYIWEVNGNGALLFDCGDLSRLSTRQLLKVSHIFLSHCHMDHFFGFDLFLRVHVGSEKKVTIFGPPETSKHVAGKLQAYTWNLVSDQTLEFVAVDLDLARRKKSTTHFRAKDAFRPSSAHVEDWNPETALLDTGIYTVRTTMLDHRTPSMAYAVEEKQSFGVNSARIREMGLKPGAWINQLKRLFLCGGLEDAEINIQNDGDNEIRIAARDLAAQILIPRKRHKIAYVTDGAASEPNERTLSSLVFDSDILFCETCFVEADRALADETKHFTATFIAKLARAARVVTLAPIHFSKRYLEDPERVYQELEQFFEGEVLRLTRMEPILRL
jgi:ribonuclease Z